jgi:spoIIIJ-associated protein
VAATEWLEIRAKDVETAVAAAVEELGVDGPDSVEVEIVQEPERGFLGMGGQDAVVKVTAKPKRNQGGGGERKRSKSSDSKGSRERKGSSNGGQNSKGQSGKSSNRQRSGSSKSNQGRNQNRPKQTPKKEKKVEVEADRSEQAAMVQEFLTGLLGAFGLEGDVTCTVEEDIIIADVAGAQTEALVGNKGAIMQSVLELSRTIVQRKSQAGARIRLDIAGYNERRREALRIYTGRLVDKVLEEGGEIMLEPMNPADRKVVHDAAAEHDGVRTFSEGEEPRRSVVIAKED